MKFYTMNQIGRVLQCSRQKVRSKVANGELEAVMWGNRILIVIPIENRPGVAA